MKQWLAQVGAERLEEMGSQDLAVDRARAFYRAQGYVEEGIDARLRGVVARDELTVTEIHQARKSLGFPQLQGNVRDAGGATAGQARRSIEAQTGQPVVSG